MLEAKSLCTPLPISRQIAIDEAKPNTTSGIGHERTRCWYLRRRELFLDFAIENTDEHPRRS